MPIRYAKDIVVDQATVDLMSKAFNDALERLRLSRPPDQEPEWVRETLALRIIESVGNAHQRAAGSLKVAGGRFFPSQMAQCIAKTDWVASPRCCRVSV
jgi:hypothetical protein